MAVEGEITVIGAGARLEGTVVSAGSLRIDGTVKGKVNADGDVILSPQSQVEADIRAENITVTGRLVGNVLATGKAEVGRGGRIDGDVTTRILVIQEGGSFNGQSIMDQQAQRILQGQQAQLRPPSTQQTAPSAPGGTSSQPKPPPSESVERARVP
jgi:cytoskeletal protein CcmA (bactofilin family)